MNEFSKGWVEEYQEASEVFGAVGALLYFSLLVVLGILGSIVVLIVGALALALSPVILVVAFGAFCLSRSGRMKHDGAKPPPDPWLSE